MQYWSRKSWENASILSEPVECDVRYLDNLFLKGSFDVCLAKVEGYLDEIKRKSCPRQWNKAEPTFTNETDRLIILAIQCHYEMKVPLEKTRSLFRKTYGEEKYQPPKVFLVWLQLLIKKGLLEEGFAETVEYLRSHVRILPSLEYKQLVELLIFHILVPLKKKTQARIFLNVNRTLDPQVKKTYLKALEKVEPWRKKEPKTNNPPSTIEADQPSQATKPSVTNVEVKHSEAQEPRTDFSLLSLIRKILLLKNAKYPIITLVGFVCFTWIFRTLQQRLSKSKTLTEYAKLFGLRKSMM